MAPQNPSAFLQNRVDHTAQIFRMAMAVYSGNPTTGSMTPRGGVHPTWGGRFGITGTSGMTVNVDTGLVQIPGSSSWQGVYVGFNSSSYPVTIPTADATNYRTDLICAQQYDVTYGDSQSAWDIIDVPGSLSASNPGPTPATPNNAIPLGTINVTPGLTATNSATITMIRRWCNLPGPVYGFGPGAGLGTPTSMVDGTMWVDATNHLMGAVLNGTHRYMADYPSNAGTDWFPRPYARTSSAQSVTNSTTLVNASQLAVPVQANAVYRVAALINYDGGSGSNEGDFKYQWSVPSGAGGTYTDARVNTSMAVEGIGFSRAWTDVRASGTTGVGTFLTVWFIGILTTAGSSGSLQFKFAQNTSTPVATAIHSNSFIVLDRLA